MHDGRTLKWKKLNFFICVLKNRLPKLLIIFGFKHSIKTLTSCALELVIFDFSLYQFQFSMLWLRFSLDNIDKTLKLNFILIEYFLSTKMATSTRASESTKTSQEIPGISLYPWVRLKTAIYLWELGHRALVS